MSEWFRFSVAFWHTFMGSGGDMFGGPTKAWPWHSPKLSPMQKAEAAMRANFELIDKLGVDYWCFHDRDIAPEARARAAQRRLWRCRAITLARFPC